MLGKRKDKRKPLKELYIEDTFTENRNEWNKELEKHSNEVYVDAEETTEVQKKDDRVYGGWGSTVHRSWEGRRDFGRPCVASHKVSGTEDNVVSAMITQLLPEK